MAKYLCVRDCFINDRLWQHDVVYDLPEDMQDCKHFQRLEQEPEQKPEKAKPDEIPEHLYWCSKCNMLHRDSSKVGKSHMKHKE